MGSNGPRGLLAHNPTLKMAPQLFLQKCGQFPDWRALHT